MITLFDFEKLNLKYGDYIWLMNKKGEGYFGFFYNDFNLSKKTFKFRNHSNGKDEIILIESLQRLERA